MDCRIEFKKISIYIFFFLYFLSIETALSNIFLSEHNTNICKSDESNTNLDCLSHCALVQMDNLKIGDDFFSHFERFLINFDIIPIETLKKTIIEPKSNSPPYILIF